MIDEDIKNLSNEDLQKEIMTLRNAIRTHRDQKGDDNCYQDDFTYLYSVLPEKVKADPQLAKKQLQITNCLRYYNCRQENKLYIPLEKEDKSPEFAVDWLDINEYTPPYNWPIVVMNKEEDMRFAYHDGEKILIEIPCEDFSVYLFSHSFKITHLFPLPKVKNVS